MLLTREQKEVTSYQIYSINNFISNHLIVKKSKHHLNQYYCCHNLPCPPGVKHSIYIKVGGRNNFTRDDRVCSLHMQQ